MGEQYFELHTVVAIPLIGGDVVQHPCHVAGVFMEILLDLAMWRIQAAARLEVATLAVRFAGTVEPRSVLG